MGHQLAGEWHWAEAHSSQPPQALLPSVRCSQPIPSTQTKGTPKTALELLIARSDTTAVLFWTHPNTTSAGPMAPATSVKPNATTPLVFPAKQAVMGTGGKMGKSKGRENESKAERLTRQKSNEALQSKPQHKIGWTMVDSFSANPSACPLHPNPPLRACHTDHHGLKGRACDGVVQTEGAVGAAIVLLVLGAGLGAGPAAKRQRGGALSRVQQELDVVAQCPVDVTWYRTGITPARSAMGPNIYGCLGRRLAAGGYPERSPGSLRAAAAVTWIECWVKLRLKFADDRNVNGHQTVHSSQHCQLINQSKPQLGQMQAGDTNPMALVEPMPF